MQQTKNQIKKSDELAIIKTRLLNRKEQYAIEKERLKGVRDRQIKEGDKEYFQGHIDALQGFITDIDEILGLERSYP
jgi:hypothetical protein